MKTQVRVPTTLNVTAFDLENPGISQVSPEVIRIQKEMVDAYLRLGCRPTMTCAPYQRFRGQEKVSTLPGLNPTRLFSLTLYWVPVRIDMVISLISVRLDGSCAAGRPAPL